jgi:hypothetical protein
MGELKTQETNEKGRVAIACANISIKILRNFWGVIAFFQQGLAV